MAKTVKVIAKAMGIAIAPRKVSIVASLVRGRSVEDALVILSHTPRRSAEQIAKTIKSAKANAINNHNVEAKDLMISEITVTAGTRLKRYRPVARGMAHPFQKKTSHLIVEVTGTQKAPVEKVSTKTTVKKTTVKEAKKAPKK